MIQKLFRYASPDLLGTEAQHFVPKHLRGVVLYAIGFQSLFFRVPASQRDTAFGILEISGSALALNQDSFVGQIEVRFPLAMRAELELLNEVQAQLRQVNAQQYLRVAVNLAH